LKVTNSIGQVLPGFKASNHRILNGPEVGGRLYDRSVRYDQAREHNELPLRCWFQGNEFVALFAKACKMSIISFSCGDNRKTTILAPYHRATDSVTNHTVEGRWLIPLALVGRCVCIFHTGNHYVYAPLDEELVERLGNRDIPAPHPPFEVQVVHNAIGNNRDSNIAEEPDHDSASLDSEGDNDNSDSRQPPDIRGEFHGNVESNVQRGAREQAHFDNFRRFNEHVGGVLDIRLARQLFYERANCDLSLAIRLYNAKRRSVGDRDIDSIDMLSGLWDSEVDSHNDTGSAGGDSFGTDLRSHKSGIAEDSREEGRDDASRSSQDTLDQCHEWIEFFGLEIDPDTLRDLYHSCQKNWEATMEALWSENNDEDGDPTARLDPTSDEDLLGDEPMSDATHNSLARIPPIEKYPWFDRMVTVNGNRGVHPRFGQFLNCYYGQCERRRLL